MCTSSACSAIKIRCIQWTLALIRNRIIYSIICTLCACTCTCIEVWSGITVNTADTRGYRRIGWADWTCIWLYIVVLSIVYITSRTYFTSIIPIRWRQTRDTGRSCEIWSSHWAHAHLWCTIVYLASILACCDSHTRVGTTVEYSTLWASTYACHRICIIYWCWTHTLGACARVCQHKGGTLWATGYIVSSYVFKHTDIVLWWTYVPIYPVGCC